MKLSEGKESLVSEEVSKLMRSLVKCKQVRDIFIFKERLRMQKEVSIMNQDLQA